MILPVYLYGHPVLREETEDITPDYPELKKLVADMYETMYHSEGVGLAAPQIGRSISVVVIDGTVLADDFPECKDLKLTLINPELEVFEDSPLVSRPEGCLSIPGVSESVRRHEHVLLRWVDEDFKPHEQEFTGFASRIIQHEFDHLLGEVFTDHISPIRKQLIRKKLGNIVEGKTRCEYRTVSSKKR
ncbi:MAG: peptide deformylase [Clostridium sp.]|nr:peptide deformylase [Prevotella sp.]MCM1428631.1 peptide deformylase [Clostridium sp.]MCM1475760.1 peptide deformylase [Muribaculaceae bacterium]